MHIPSAQTAFPLDPVGALKFVHFIGIEGFHVWSEAHIPQNTWTLRLVLGFFSDFGIPVGAGSWAGHKQLFFPTVLL